MFHVTVMYCHFFIAFYYFKSVALLEPPELPDFCSLSCNEKRHTVCTRNYVCKPISNCMIMPVDLQFREKMLSTHNILRNNIANGSTKGRYGNIGAKNMRALSYDMELEFLAECWSTLCPGFRHDDCRDTDRFPVGQNIYFAKNVHDPKVAVHYWFQKGLDDITDPNFIKKFPYFSDHPGNLTKICHFSQMVWAETQYIGCSWAKFGPDHEKSLIVCNYGPSGNVKDEPVYKMAVDPALIAEDCPEGRNPKYRALCGCSERISGNPSWAQTFGFRPDVQPQEKKDGATRKWDHCMKYISVYEFLIFLANRKDF